MTGFNNQPEAAGDYPDTVRLDVYVHDRAVWPNCPRNYIDENNRVIDLPTKVKWIGGGMARRIRPLEQVYPIVCFDARCM